MKSCIDVCKGGLISIAIVFWFSACAPLATLPKDTIKEGTAEGKAAIERAIATDEKAKQDAFKSAEHAFSKGDIEGATNLFTGFARNFPETDMADDAYFRLGELYLQKGDFDRAIESFQKIITDYIGSDLLMEAKYKLALTYFNKGLYNDSIQTLKSLLELPVGRARKVAVNATIADSYYNLGQKIEALPWYERALTGEPGEAVASRIRKRAMSIISDELSINEVEDIAERQAGTFIGDYAKYAVIINMVDEERYEEAKKEAARFVRQTDIDALKVKGEEILEVISQRMNVNAGTIGCILPLSGRFAVYGKKLLNGVQLAAGIFDDQMEERPVNLIIKDSMGDPAEASKAVKELVAHDRVIAIIGPLISSVAEKAAVTAQEKGVPMMTLSKKAGIPETGDYIFRNFLTNLHQTRTLARHAVKELGIRRFAILYPKDSYGEELMHLFWNDVTMLGGEIVGIEGYNSGQYDFGAEIKKLVGMNDVDKKEEEEKPESDRLWPVVDFEAIFIPDGYEKAGLMSSQLVYYDVEGVQLLGTNSWHSTKLIDIGTEYVNGAIFVSGFYKDSNRESTKQFTKAFEESFSETPGIMEAMSYDATRMITDAIRSGKAKSRVEMRDALYLTQGFNGATGETSVTETGDVEKKLFILTVKHGEIVELLKPEAGNEERGLTAEEMPPVFPESLQ